MSLRLLIDEDSQDKLLVKLLREVGHDVITVNDAGLTGSRDTVVLNYAKVENRVLLTLNCRDFQILHQATPNHPGILAVYRDANPANNMSFAAIVAAIANLQAVAVPLANQFMPLNQWNY